MPPSQVFPITLRPPPTFLPPPGTRSPEAPPTRRKPMCHSPIPLLPAASSAFIAPLRLRACLRILLVLVLVLLLEFHLNQKSKIASPFPLIRVDRCPFAVQLPSFPL